VLLLRLTEKRFSATQYALFSSLFALPRVLAGPITGFTVDALGWSIFFLSTIVVGIPGLVMLGRFVPLGAVRLRLLSADGDDESCLVMQDIEGQRVLSRLSGRERVLVSVHGRCTKGVL